jgi:hypothetical protein
LTPDGVFLQWLQAYDIDGETVATILATLADVLPEVEIWQTHDRDLLLVGSKKPLAHDLEGLVRRIGQEPYATALRVAWRATDVHEVLGRFVGGPAVARHFRQGGAALNTDDRNLVEFSFARTVSKGPFDIEQLRAYADRLGASRLAMDGVDWDRVRRHRVDAYTIIHVEAPLPPGLPAADRTAAEAQRLRADSSRARSSPKAWPRPAISRPAARSPSWGGCCPPKPTPRRRGSPCAVDGRTWRRRLSCPRSPAIAPIPGRTARP